MDKRKLNGGHSTKTLGVDKRKNTYRQALEEASTVEEVKEIIIVLKKLAKGEDLQAIKLFLEYYLGKPKETIENINLNGNKELTPEDIKKISDALDDTYR